MDVYYVAVDLMRMFALAVGTFIIFAGIVHSVFVARGVEGRARVARQIGGHAALGLDLFVGATLLNLSINPTWTTLATTAITIVARKLLTFSLGLQQRKDNPAGGPSTG